MNIWSYRDTSKAYKAFMNWESSEETRQLACKLGLPEAKLRQALFATSRAFQETSRQGWHRDMEVALSQADTRQKLLALLNLDDRPKVQARIPAQRPMVMVLLGIPLSIAGLTLLGHLIQ
jgi:hypothetical protein